MAGWSALLTAACLAAARILARRPDPLLYAGVMAVPFVLYLAASVDVLAGRCRGGLAWILLGGLGMGLAFASCPPLFENDFYRYEWDARVWAAGINPYRYAPADPALARLRGPSFGSIGYPTVPTCYPPMAEAWFRAAVTLADACRLPALRGFQALDLLLGAGVTVLLWDLLRGAGLPPERAALWGLSPLAAREFGNSGHADVLAIFLVVAAMAAVERRRPWCAGILLGLAVDARLYPLILAPFLFRPLGREEAARATAATGLTALAGFVPFASAGPMLWRGLGVYAMHWRFNAPLFTLLSAAFPSGARFMAAALLALALALRWTGPRTPGADGVFALGALLLLSPTFDPWYLTWMLPFLALAPSPSWLAMTGLVNASYLYYLDQQPSWSIWALEFAPFVALALWGWWRGAARARRSPHHHPRSGARGDQ